MEEGAVGRTRLSESLQQVHADLTGGRIIFWPLRSLTAIRLVSHNLMFSCHRDCSVSIQEYSPNVRLASSARKGIKTMNKSVAVREYIRFVPMKKADPTHISLLARFQEFWGIL
jgi:hypothetical protein